ncbi:MAG TPA: UvrD-helicase domain-containing protein, partial [Bacteroidales bacterium]
MNFVVYKSSAGSGKTYSLVKEYIILALSQPDNYCHILAVTFTNKAANEMKQRILTNLRQLADPIVFKNTATVKSMLPELCTITGQTTDELSYNAGLILTRILHNYSDFAISTIDSFVNRIIRTFARDLKLPLNFDVEMNSSRLIDQAIDRLIARVGNDKQLTDVLIEYIENKADSENGWNIEGDMAEFGKQLFNEQGILKAEKLKELSLDVFSNAEKTMIAFRRTFEKHVSEIAKEAMAIILSKGIDNNSFYYGKQGIGNYFSNLANGRMDKLAPNTRVLKTVEEDCWYTAKTDAEQVHAINEIKGALGDYYLAITDYASGANLQCYKLFGLLVFNLYPLALLSEMEKEIAQIRSETNIVHIFEFNRRIAEIVMNEPVPFIYERLGEKFHHYLIDEFQDTSRLQWMNLLPLLENSLASGYFNMIVGDGKQAIYRWRSGYVEQFVNLPFIENPSGDEYIGQRETILRQNYEEKLLDTNYRSQQGIVNFNNDFFDHAAGILSGDLQRVYEHSQQIPKSNAEGGFVSLEFIDKGPDDEKVADRMLARSLELVQSLITKDHYALNDIVVLTRSKKDGSLVANCLVDAGIPVVSSESLLLSASPEVKMMVAMLRILLNPADKVAVVEAIHLMAKWNSGGSEDLHKVWSGVLPNIRGEAPIPQTGFIEFLQQLGIDFNPTNLQRLPLYDLCEQLIRMFGLNTNPNAYLQFFLDVVHKQGVTRGMGLSAFLDYWDEQQAELSVVVPEQLDAVRIMTIHKAKGLEFPVVIFPFASDDARTNRNYLWIDLDEPSLEKLPIALV